MIWIVDPADATPLYEQLVTCVRKALISGELSPGDRLPAARELADSLDLNMHTVLHAYQELRDTGVLELRRGRGAIVRQSLAAIDLLASQIQGLLSDSRRLGLTVDELAVLIRRQAREGEPT